LPALCILPARAQDGSDTRAGQILEERARKTQALKPETGSRVENFMREFADADNLAGRLLSSTNGFGLKFGGLRSGSGFGFGPRYFRRDLANEKVMIETSLVASLKRYWSADVSLRLPSIKGSRFDAEFTAGHSDSPSVSYFGSGPDSRRADRSNYRREDTVFAGRLGVRLYGRSLSAGYYTGLNLVNVGPGRSAFSPSTSERFSAAAAPGLDRQARYLLTGPYVTFDTRDWPGDPHRGTYASASFLRYNDSDMGRYSFKRLNAQVEHYIPLTNETRVIALRARTEMSFVKTGQSVPFFLQPTLGGGDDLRGFDRYRFQDNNSVLMNAEYRWDVSPALGMALFADAGNVFSRPGLIGFRNMEGAGGVGFRFKSRNLVVMRLDTGVSREGFRIWLRFSDVYRSLPLFR
jgi:outer membrane protein assembly factor BamA